jgi:hypothetical protein
MVVDPQRPDVSPLQSGSRPFNQIATQEMSADGGVPNPRFLRVGPWPPIALARPLPVANIHKRISFHAASNHGYRE